jgi:5-methyltetrahydrofolate--homocysteine methyltransferase
MMLESAGFEMIDLGVNAKVSAIAAAAVERKADLVGLSALLTTTMLAMKPAIKAIRGAGAQVKVMVGGAPITQEWAREAGADGFAPDALRAINLAKSLLGIN